MSTTSSGDSELLHGATLPISTSAVATGAASIATAGRGGAGDGQLGGLALYSAGNGAGVAAGSPKAQRSARYGRAPHPGHLPVLHFPSERAHEAITLVPVLDPRYLTLPSLPRLNKWQHRMCAECNSPQTTGMFGNKALLCHYTELLFCTSCMGSEARQIPWRVVHLLDTQPKRVWSLAAEFIDGLWGQPIVDMKAMAPLVYSSHPHLEALTSLRGRLQQAMELHSAAKGVADTARAVRAILGDQLMYLSQSRHLLALANVTAAAAGDLAAVVAAAISALALDR